MTEAVVDRSLDGMRRDWDRRASEDTLYWVYVVYGRQFADREFYYRDGAAQAVQMLSPYVASWGCDPAGRAVLELGCGIGRLFPGFAQLGFSRIVGVDVSPEMVTRGREWCPVADAEFIVVDGDRLAGVESSSMDYCFSYNVLGHLPSSRIFWRNIEEMARVLKPGGYIQAHFRGWQSLKRRIARRVPDSFVPAARSLYRMARLHSRASSNGHDPGHRQTFEFGVAVSPKRVAEKLSGLGFTGVGTTVDSSYSDGSRVWVAGRKGGKERLNGHRA